MKPPLEIWSNGVDDGVGVSSVQGVIEGENQPLVAGIGGGILRVSQFEKEVSVEIFCDEEKMVISSSSLVIG